MGVEPYLISASLVGVVAQRLVRKICDNCKISYTPDIAEQEVLKIFSDTQLYKGKGCNQCYNTGYKGRIAIHEIMPLNREIRLLIDNRANIDELRNNAVEQGMFTLRENCQELVIKGITTFDELIRVTYTGE